MKKRSLLLVALTVVMTAALIGPVSAAITRFTDVPDTNIFASDILWMDENEITSGCGTDLFCPTANVTREQMSAFMHRLATKQVVDAATVGGSAASDFAPKIHEHDADYLAVDGTAVDSALVGGLAASDLMRVATYSFTDDKKPDDFGRLATFQITAPVDGFLMLSSSLEAITTATSEHIWCAFSLDAGTTWISGSETVENATNASPGFWTDCNSETVTPVTAGTHTVTVGGNFSSLLNTNFSWGTASALFIPFDGAGQQPTDFTPATLTPDQTHVSASSR